MKNWFNKYLLALVAGLVLLALPVLYVMYEGADLQQLNPQQHLIQNGLTYLLLLLFSYANHVYFVPRLFMNKQYGQYAVVVFVWLLGVVWLPHRVEQWAFLKALREPTIIGWLGQLLWKENLFPGKPKFPPTHRDDNSHRTPTSDHAGGPLPANPGQGPPLGVKLTLIFLLGSVSTLASLSVQTNNRLRQLEAQQLQAELHQLKAQIHPHFLFNTLNSIYALAIRHDERTADTIVKLADRLGSIWKQSPST